MTLSGFLCGEPKIRWQSHKTVVDADILTPYVIWRLEGFNSFEGDDSFDTPNGKPISNF